MDAKYVADVRFNPNPHWVPALLPHTALDQHVSDYVHATGTCGMGRVVDADCRVIGYEQLFVCDASVMPDLPKATTLLTTVAIAEQFAQRFAPQNRALS